MNARVKAVATIAGCVALCFSIAAVGAAGAPGKKKDRHIGTKVEATASAVKKGRRALTVSGQVTSKLPRCERQRSVLLYEVGPNGDFVGGAIGHGVSRGGSKRGQVTIAGLAPKKIKPSRRFRIEAVGRRVKVKVKGKKQEIICKRGVSVEFPGNIL
ncbi:MAG: hypothetical protein EXQ70_06185 [Solirubrobacterales bacterium]|nr:hypothetical protein [Solirubrobacterales bacterium]